MAMGPDARPMRIAPSDLATYLVGRWEIDREIQDSRAGRVLQFSGAALVIPLDEHTLRYEEQGELEAEDGALEMHRSYTYRLLGGARAEVLFDDGSTFHHLDLSGGADRVRHDCGEDLYLGTVVTEVDTWWTRWSVSGPAKDYVAMTRAERVARPN